MDDNLREELNNVFDEAVGTLVAAGAAGFATGRLVSMAFCAKKFGKGTPKYKNCMSMKNTPAGKLVQGAGKAVQRLRGKK